MNSKELGEDDVDWAYMFQDSEEWRKVLSMGNFFQSLEIAGCSLKILFCFFDCLIIQLISQFFIYLLIQLYS